MALTHQRHDLPDGSAAFLIGHDSDDFAAKLKRAANGTQTETPTPQNDEREDEGGPVTRFTDEFSPLGMGLLEHVGLSGHETADAVQMRVTELFRNEFPVIQPRFERKCTECAAEFEERVEECEACGADTREPDAAERHRFERRLERVNKEGQSFRELAKSLEFDQGFNGVPILVIQYKWAISPQGQSAPVDWTNLIKGDPKRIVPVVDENRRIGGYWWACPRCRHAENYRPAESPGRCDFSDDCNAELREVYFAEKGRDYSKAAGGDGIEAYYFDAEVLTFPWYFPRLHGLDGLGPAHHVWLKQLIIEYQDQYAASFYDPDSDRLPNQFMLLHTTNPDAWDELLEQARQNAKEDEYDVPIYSMEYDAMANERPEVQVVDAMPDELLGQNGELKDTFKKDIRQAFNIADVFDSDLAEAGGLNNEGLQLEVTDRSIATQMHDYATGWLDELARRLGVEDWSLGFIPSTGPDAEDLLQEVQAGKLAEESGLDARMVGGQAEVADGEFDVPEPPAGGGFGDEPGSGLPTGAAESAGDGSSHDFGPDVDPLHRADTGDLDAACDTLFRAHEHMVFPDLGEQRAREPFWDDDQSMPEMVKRAIREALRSGAISATSSFLPAGTTRGDVRRFFEEKLDQPQGWSLRSLTEDYADRFGVAKEKAATAVRRQTKSILDMSREVAYEAQGDMDERVFKWLNPVDDATTQASMDVLEASNPDYGGTPRPLPELKQIVAEARREHFPKLTGAEWADSWQDRGTYVEHFD